MTRFQIVSTNAVGDIIVQVFDTNDPAAAFAERGYSPSPRPAPRHLRPELRNQPTFIGLAGPQWGGERDGAPIIRYETTQAYNLLSA